MEYEEKISPFVLYEKATYKRTKYPDATKDNIKKMLVDGSLTKMHDMVLNILCSFGYLNSYMIREYLKYLSSGEYDYNSQRMRKVMKEFVRTGFVVQYEMFHKEEDKELGSPFIYCLSNGGVKYLKKQGNYYVHPVLKKRFCLTDVLELLALNQYHITLMCEYGLENNILENDYYSKNFKEHGIPLMYRLKMPFGGNFVMYVNVVRENDDEWIKKYLMSMKKLSKFLEINNINNYIVITVVETEYMAMLCAKRKNCVAEIKDMINYYITDTAILVDDIFSRLINVLPKNDYSYREIFSLELREKNRKEENYEEEK